MQTMQTITPKDFGLPAEFTSFRDYPSGKTQFDTVEEIVTSDSRFIKLSAPTGIGKSLLYILYALLLNKRVLILTPNKALQKQLMDDFASIGLVDLQGQGNYKCLSLQPGGEHYNGTKEQCDVGLTMCNNGKSKCIHKVDCHYLNAVDIAKKSDLVQMNYSKWVCSSSDAYGEFDVIVCDEAHKLVSILQDYCQVDMSKKWLTSALGITPPDSSLGKNDLYTWCDEVYDLVKAAQVIECNPREYTRLNTFLDSLDRLKNPNVRWVREEMVNSITYKPVWAKVFAESFIYRGVEKILLVSATISSKTLHYLGVPKDKCSSINVESIFPLNRRPIISFSSNGPMAPVKMKQLSKMHNGYLNVWARQIDRIIESRPNVKGIIHSVSYAWAEEIYNRCANSDLMVTHTRKNAASVIEKFLSDPKPGVLVSPVVGEGRNFIYGKGRYQIIPKLPFIYMGTALMQARASGDKGYHSYLVEEILTQMFGRPVRAVDDYGETFILDGQWEWFCKQGNWAPWVKEAFVQQRDIIDCNIDELRTGECGY